MRRIIKHFYSPYVPWRLLGLLLLIGLAINVYYLTRTVTLVGTAHPDRIAYTTGAIAILYALLLGVLCCIGLRHHSRNPPNSIKWTRQYLSPLLIGASLWCYALSQVAWVCVMFITGQFPGYPSPEHFTQLGIYPCLIGAILLLPGRNLSWWSRLRVLLDSLMIIVAVATLCYYFLLAPLLMNSDGTVLEKIVSGSFLAADLILLFCLLLVALQYGEPELRPVLTILFLAILAFFAVHTVHAYELLRLQYNEFSKVDAGLAFIGALLVGAARTITNMLNHRATIEIFAPEQNIQTETGGVPSTSWHGKGALPSILVLIFALLIFIIWLSGGQKAFPGQILIVYAGGFSALVLMLLRQFLTFYQINILRNQIQGKNRSLALLNLQLEQQATIDPLTGLPNHRTLVERLDEALANAQETGSSCGLVFMDIDHFKSINDRHGHSAGDEILRQFSEAARSCLPPNGCVGRWGGEEFVAILPRSDPSKTRENAEHLRVCIDREVQIGDKRLRVTCSLGVANYPQDALTRDNLITQADRAMYAAKSLGRNQVRSAREPLVLELDRAKTEVVTERAEMLETVDALLALLQARDYSVCQHAKRVGALSLKLAQALGLSENEAQTISLGGLLHNLGKVAISDAVLRTQGLHSGEEHPLIGAEILAPVPSLQAVAAIVRSHHERVDGSGYPAGLRGEEIPLGARIVAVADAYDALTSRRASPSRPAHSSTEALRELRAGSGSQFDPRIVEALSHLLATVPRLSRSDVA